MQGCNWGRGNPNISSFLLFQKVQSVLLGNVFVFCLHLTSCLKHNHLRLLLKIVYGDVDCVMANMSPTVSKLGFHINLRMTMVIVLSYRGNRCD